ncbi:MAG: TM0106 family RecB-like putative nuclease [Chloroflexi bacterium]|nr:TM0106 family RecB-like putative nuclease [Chloroflexota bacterium]
MDTETRVISDELFCDFLHCERKSKLRQTGCTADKGAFEQLQERLDADFRAQANSQLLSNCPPNAVHFAAGGSPHLPSVDADVILDAVVEANGLCCSFDALRRRPPRPPNELSYYEPIRFCRTTPTRKNQHVLAFDALVLSDFQNAIPIFGNIMWGSDFSTKRIRLPALLDEARVRVAKLSEQFQNVDTPPPLLNDHCRLCEFNALCKAEAVEQDHLSLLTGMSTKEIRKHNQRGIFTVNQLSYTYRYRRPPKRAKKLAMPHNFALQARSLRENTIPVHGTFDLPNTETNVFLDIEGLPDRKFYYLIGVLVATRHDVKYHGFWTDDDQQGSNFQEFLSFLSVFPDCPIFHFGRYDSDAIRNAAQHVTESLHPQLSSLRARLVNVLTLVYHHIYFPTYSNSLKDIGRFIGYEWSSPNASGTESILWRHRWDETQSPEWKAKLLEYNKDDCLALKRLHDFICTVKSADPVQPPKGEDCWTIRDTKEYRRDNTNKPVYGKARFVIEELDRVNSCAYFDYQRERVYVRTNKEFRRINKRTQKQKTPLAPNKIIELSSKRCPCCKSKNIRQRKLASKDLIDLRRSSGGIRKWVVRHVGPRYECPVCYNSFQPAGIPTSREIYGHGLKSWCVYQHVARKQSMLQVYHGLGDIFDLRIPNVLYRFKSVMAELYTDTYHKILGSILAGPLIHADETPFRLKKADGYVWVFTSMNSVFYLYRASRDGGFLKDVLKDYSGVLVSDFFTAYDSIDCPQQKCLIHLMRDMNDSLRKNPYDNEFKEMCTRFSAILRSMIDTVDRYGLKKRHLQKHKNDARRFLCWLEGESYHSVIAQGFQKRFEKAEWKLFTFLDHDGIPWNNNNAEHAMKFVARKRRYADGLSTAKSLREFLILLSVIQTCEYNNVNVLEFLFSGKTDLESITPQASTVSPSPAPHEDLIRALAEDGI